MRESLVHPWKTAFITRLIFLPAGLKDYILSLINNPFKSYTVSAVVLHGFFTFESVLIGLEFNEIEKFLEEKKSWS